ncbi:hypothetical protein AT246_05070 [Bartonella henselae]|nr:hypothetical protein AT247_03110 [Bartonella henselae]OLL48985.1 hypothetical protein AT241_01625 [Bartonella henselae]OLL49543.1 hypothetical protein AT243_02750 [Bartonella henselae]OLL58603.1 hypothetical protein AT246_05070 [Bartonella henselae]
MLFFKNKTFPHKWNIITVSPLFSNLNLRRKTWENSVFVDGFKRLFEFYSNMTSLVHSWLVERCISEVLIFSIGFYKMYLLAVLMLQ